MWKEGSIMKKNGIVILLGMIISIIVIVFSILHYKANFDITIYTKKDSYAKEYAEKHSLKVELLSNIEEYFNEKYETFAYNVENDEIVITKYEGKSERLIIPKEIGGKKVVKVLENSLPNSVKTIVISSNILELELSQNVNIECYRGSYCEKLKEEKDGQVTILDDSVYTNFYNQNTVFDYEEENGEIELIRYTGSQDKIIIPEQINGYPVTTISFQVDDNASIYIPNTISKISSNFLSMNIHKVHISVMIVILISLLLVILCNIKNDNQTLEKTTRYVIINIISIVYLCIMGIFSLLITDYEKGINLLFIELLISSMIYVFIIMLLKISNKKIEKLEEKNKEVTTFIKQAKLLVLEIEDKDVKDAISFMDPVSSLKSKEIEDKIIDMLKNYNVSDKDELLLLIKKRNNIIKISK